MTIASGISLAETVAAAARPMRGTQSDQIP